MNFHLATKETLAACTPRAFRLFPCQPITSLGIQLWLLEQLAAIQLIQPATGDWYCVGVAAVIVCCRRCRLRCLTSHSDGSSVNFTPYTMTAVAPMRSSFPPLDCSETLAPGLSPPDYFQWMRILILRQLAPSTSSVEACTNHSRMGLCGRQKQSSTTSTLLTPHATTGKEMLRISSNTPRLHTKLPHVSFSCSTCR